MTAINRYGNASAAGNPQQGGGAAPVVVEPPVSAGDSYSSALRLAKDDTGWNLNHHKLENASRIFRALPPEARQRAWLHTRDLTLIPDNEASGSNLLDDAWDSLVAYRRSHAGFLKEVPTSRPAFDEWVMVDFAKRHAADKTLQARVTGFGGNLASLAGSALGSMSDPLNAATTLISGGGRSVAQIFGRELLVNGLAEAAQQPGVAVRRKEFGDELTIREAATNVVTAGVFGGVLGSGFHVGGKAIAAGIQKARPGSAIASALKRAKLPEASDADVLDAFRHAYPEGTRTPDERAAVAVMERQAETDAVNPFDHSKVGLEAHADKMNRAGEALARTLNGGDAAAFRAMDRGTDPAVLRGAARPRETAPVDLATEAAAFKARVRRAESGGDDAARNPNSSATGRYQFIDSTWLSTYRKVYGATGESPAAILGKRRDSAVNEALMDRLTADNAVALRRMGAPPTAGNLYLAHFLGEGGVARVLRAADDAPLASILPEGVLNANPFLRGMRAGELENWAARKMGRSTGPTGPIARDAAQGIDDALAAGEARLAALDSEEAALSASGGDAFPDLELPEIPRLKREGFASDEDWHVAQARVDAEAVGDAVAVKPLVTTIRGYHGSKAQFDTFDTARGSNPGSWFAADEAAAAPFGAVKAYDLTIANPATLDDLARVRREVVANDGTLEAGTPAFNRAVIDAMQAEGFDGIRSTSSKGAGGSEVSVIFDPGQATPAIRDATIDEAAGLPDAIADAWDRQIGEGFTPSPVYVVQSNGGQQPRGYPLAIAPTPQMARELAAKFDGNHDIVRVDPDTFGFSRYEPTPDAVTARFDDPAGPEVTAQIDSLTHDVTRAVEDGAHGDAAFLSSEGAAETPVLTLARLDEEDAALAAVRACL